MPADDFNDTVVLELLSPDAAPSLHARLVPHWHTLCVEAAEVSLVAVELRPGPGDLATLLRTVQAWAAEAGIPAIRFHLDGRPYVLDAAPVLARGAAA